ncbi:MAG: Xaa-Pro peptidase family protein [Candidatus Diapherotrites archaeon]|nr:Xaa-Pro peptidase family protein [Candidatus Diapherotrites archaeon]
MEKLWKKIDSIYLRNLQDYWHDPITSKYLGREAGAFEGFLILRKDKKPLWVSHPFNYAQAKKEFSKKILVKTFDTRNSLKKIFEKKLGKKVGYNGTHLTVVELKNLKKKFQKKKFIDVSNELLESRKIKSNEEIQKISAAANETKKLFPKIKKMLKKGITEKELAAKLKEEAQKNGMELAFCIVAFGKNTCQIHHAPNDTKFSFGAVMIDIGIKLGGYHSDITKTFWVGKKIKEFKEFEKASVKVETGIKNIEKKLAPGITAEKLFEETKILGKLPHALGHGIGLETHDALTIGEKSKWKLEEGMVLAVEPAIYTKKFGVRIEHNYLITKKGFRKL